MRFSRLKKYSIFIRYTIYGVGTTVVNICVYFALTHYFGDGLYQLWNVIAWIFAVLYSFVVNEKFVFKVKAKSSRDMLKKFFGFTSGRVFSLLVECGILFVMVSLLDFNDKIVKLFSNFIVVMINYYFSKKIVFKK